MASSAVLRPALTGIWLPAPSPAPRTRLWSGTPEIYFQKDIDNSRLVKIADRKRNREMGVFSAVLGVFFLLVMVYAWQHFSAVEYGYKIEALTSQRDNLREANRSLRLEEASLTDPQRIDDLARNLGLQAPQPGQVIRLDGPSSDPGTPVMARVSEIAVVTAGQ